MPLYGAQANVFGADSDVHPVTKMPLEKGIGALPHRQQAELHCVQIHLRDGKEAADEMRQKLADADRLATVKSALATDHVSMADAEYE